MIAHVVLLSPRPDLTAEQRAHLVGSVARAAREIPSVRAARVGRRVRHGQAYEEHMAADFAFCVIFEFDDLAGLQTYLRHPAHEDLGAGFYDSMAAALAYDYEMGDVGQAREWSQG